LIRASTSPAARRRGAGGSQSRARPRLVEAAWSVVQQPGPLRAFYERIRARRGNKIAVVACARKLAVLFWCLLSLQQPMDLRLERLKHARPRRPPVARWRFAPERPPDRVPREARRPGELLDRLAADEVLAPQLGPLLH
jgi:hypothetical protein